MNLCAALCAFSCTLVLLSLNGCEDEGNGNTDNRSNALYIHVTDSNGQNIPKASVYYTCWGAPSDVTGSDCTIGSFVNSFPLIKDSLGSFLVYPSPCTDYCNIHFEVSRQSNVNLSLYDFERRNKIQTLIDATLQVGTHEALFSFENPDSLHGFPFYPGQASANGMYWLRLQEDYSVIWKRVLVYDRRHPFYITDENGILPISYASLPFGYRIERLTEIGTVLDSYVLQGDSLGIRCSAPGFKDSYAVVYVADKKLRDVIIKLSK